MKTITGRLSISAVCFMLSTLPPAVNAQTVTSASGPHYAVIQRGPGSRVWQTANAVTNALTGAVEVLTNQYTELGDGLCYETASGWADSLALIEATPTGAQAVHGPLKAQFALSSLKAPGAITLTTASGQVFQSHPLEVDYFDAASGKTMLVAPLQACAGTLQPPAQVVYSNAFNANGLVANVRYVYAKNGFAQDIEIWQLPDPRLFGLNPAHTRLQVRTLFDGAPQPQGQRQVVLKQQTDPVLRKTMVSPDLVGHLLFFGDAWFPVGAVFPSPNGAGGTNQPAALRVPNLLDPNNAPVGASWTAGNGQTAVLVESVDYTDLASRLAAPATGPATRPVILDYTELSGSQDAWTFYGGTTYVISNSFTVGTSGGLADFEGGTCVKFATNAYLMVLGHAYFNYPPPQSANPVFTCADDNDSGQTINGTTGIPAAEAAQEVWLYYGMGPNIGPALFNWAQTAVQYDVDPSLDNSYYVDGCTFQNSSIGVYSDLGSSSLYLGEYAQDTYCHVTTPLDQVSGYIGYNNLIASCTTPSASFTESPSGGLVPLTVQFTDASTGCIAAWDWNFGDGSSHADSQDPAHTYTANGVYTVTLTLTGGNGTQYHATNTIQVDGADFTYGPITGQASLTVNFTNTSTGATSYSWTFGDGATSTSPNPSHTYAFGTYTVSLTVNTGAGQSSKSVIIYVSPSTIINASHMSGNQAETTVAINPANTNVVVAFSFNATGNSGLFEGVSTDGGSTWTTNVIASTTSLLPPATWADECATFDKFGNLFLVYGTTNYDAAVLDSTNNGSSFFIITNFATQLSPNGGLEQPWIATGPSGTTNAYAVWVSYDDIQTQGASGPITNSVINACGAPIYGYGSVGTFGSLESIAVPAGVLADGDRVAVGPTGKVMCTFQSLNTSPSHLYYSVDPDGLGASVFSSATVITNTLVSWGYVIPAQSTNRGITAGGTLAWDISGLTYNGRVYFVYTDMWSSGSYDTDIYLLFSDNNGSSWKLANGGARLNGETNGTSQFQPAIAVDQTTGKLGISWYDARNDSLNNRAVQYFGAVSSNGGTNFSVNLQLTPGQTDINLLSSSTWKTYNGLLDYTGLAYYNGVLFAVWSDNSNNPQNPANPDGSGALDTYVSKFSW